jgi:hypothetical protein
MHGVWNGHLALRKWARSFKQDQEWLGRFKGEYMLANICLCIGSIV